MADAALKQMTREEFLAWNEQQPDRYEFVGGEIYAMTGGTRDHFLIGGNIHAALRAALKGTPCRVFSASPRVEAANEITYPDAVVTSEPMAPRTLAITQPRVIVEVLSPSTAARDRGEKWAAYQTLPSLECYLLVSQDRPRVEMYVRAANTWGYLAATGLDAHVELSGLGVKLARAAIYEGCFVTDPGAEQTG